MGKILAAELVMGLSALTGQILTGRAVYRNYKDYLSTIRGRVFGKYDEYTAWTRVRRESSRLIKHSIFFMASIGSYYFRQRIYGEYATIPDIVLAAIFIRYSVAAASWVMVYETIMERIDTERQALYARMDREIQRSRFGDRRNSQLNKQSE